MVGVFAIAVAPWISRCDLEEIECWGSRLAAEGLDLNDSTVAVAAALVLFVVPRRGDCGAAPIVDWSVAPQLPWGVLLLMGAGF